MITTTYFPYGAQTLFTYRAESPAELSIHLNTLCNFGMFTEESIPGTFNDGVDAVVTVGAQTKHVDRVLIAQAEAALFADPTFTSFFKGQMGSVCKAEARAMATKRAKQVFAGFQRVNEGKLAPELSEKQKSDYTVEADQNTAAFKASKRRILGALRK